MGDSRERFVESAEMILTGLEQGYCEYDGKHIKQPKARIRPEPFKSFKNRTYAAAVSAESSQIMAKLGIGILVIPQKPWEVHAQELRDYNELFMQVHGRAAPPPYVAGWVMCDNDAGRAEELAREYIVGYWRSVVQHYEMNSNHFATTKGYEYYTNLNTTIEQMGIDGMAKFFMDLQVWGTPEMCFEKIKDIQGRTNACGFTGIFSYAGMPLELGRANQSLFAKEVIPELKKIGERPAFEFAVIGGAGGGEEHRLDIALRDTAKPIDAGYAGQGRATGSGFDVKVAANRLQTGGVYEVHQLDVSQLGRGGLAWQTDRYGAINADRE
jgi:alkanesulfonate monooxygenase SsuD/methylene tetrahydromethanopterin reductase-like flavin-dependent oxidoreductase (luciferase family)